MSARRGMIQATVFDLGDQAVPAQFCNQVGNVSTALLLFKRGFGWFGIQMSLQVFVVEADQGVLAE